VENAYKKKDGWIYKQRSNNCYVYEKYMEFNKFLEKIFDDNPIFNSNISIFSNLMEYLKYRDEKRLQNIESNLSWIAFRNGCLNLDTCEFVKSEHLNKNDGVAARHYIDQDFIVKETPLFDKLVKYQVETEEMYSFLLFFIGRLFFKVKQYDNYQVMPFLKGAANTGKSTLINIVIAMLCFDNIGVISANQEKNFGLGSVYDKEMAICSDVPKDLVKILDPTLIQDMISGGCVSVTKKYKDAKACKWTTPLMLAGNEYLCCSDEHGAISRRFVYIPFDRQIKDRDTTLEQKIICNELPSILLKCVQTYHNIVSKHKNADFWSFCPEEFRAVKEEGKRSENFIHKFLEDVHEVDGVKKWVKHEVGVREDVDVVKRAYAEYMRVNHPTIRYKFSTENAAWSDCGFSVSRLNVCKACLKPGGIGCCERYSDKNRTKKTYIKNLRLIEECL
jgi:phage/plasmid-associated DNA primase